MIKDAGWLHGAPVKLCDQPRHLFVVPVVDEPLVGRVFNAGIEVEPAVFKREAHSVEHVGVRSEIDHQVARLQAHFVLQYHEHVLGCQVSLQVAGAPAHKCIYCLMLSFVLSLDDKKLVCLYAKKLIGYMQNTLGDFAHA